MDSPLNESPLKIVQTFQAAIMAGEMEKAFALLAEDIEWRLVGPTTIPYYGSYSGIDAVKEFFQRVAEHEQLTEFQPSEFLEGENSVTVIGRESGIATATGKAFQSEWAHIFSVHDGKITRFLEYMDTAAIEPAFK